jgi:hypothetical protein
MQNIREFIEKYISDVKMQHVHWLGEWKFEVTTIMKIVYWNITEMRCVQMFVIMLIEIDSVYSIICIVFLQKTHVAVRKELLVQC